MRHLFTLLSLWLLLLLLAAASEAVQYQIIDLGNAIEVSDINNSGDIAGSTDYSDFRAAMLRGSDLQDLGTLGGSMSQSTSINGNCEVAGISSQTGISDHAFLWRSGVMKDLGTLGGGYSESTDLNDATYVVGDSTTTEGACHAFLWHDGAMQDLGTLGGGYSEANGINNQGQVVGASYIASGNVSHAFIWQNGAMQDLGTLDNAEGSWSVACKINDSGQVVGTASYGSADHAVLWQNDTIEDLGTLGGRYSEAFDIDNAGDVVGDSEVIDSETGGVSSHAFVWSHGIMQDLGMLIGDTYNSQAVAINDQGQIIGCYSDADNVYHAVLWEPVPEPSSLAALGFGLLPLAGFVARRRRLL